VSQPPVYNRRYNFANFQATSPSDPLPGNSIDVELNSVKITLDATLANLALIQRDDGALANGSVGLDQLSAEVTVGFNVPTVWVTAHSYSTADTTFHGSGFYRCLVAHTSGVFATDLSASKWELIVDLSAIATVTALQVAVTPSGNISSTNVADAINELDNEKAPNSHTHVASAISDSTADGQAFLTATLAAQKALLGLGALAFLDSVPLTTASAQFALTGSISPGALAADTNDWAPTGLATASRVRLSANAAINITGLLATSDGDVKIIENIGSTNSVTLKSESASSSAANRFTGYSDIVIRAKESCVLIYDGTTARWRLLAPQAVQSTPTTQVLTSGSAATYTTATGATRLKIRMIGAGGGGGGTSSDASATNGGAGNATSFNSITAAGGTAGAKSISGGVGSPGASSSNGSGTALVRIVGGGGFLGSGATAGAVPIGGGGGVSMFGGAGAIQGVNASGAATNNSGSGGSGGAPNSSASIGTGGGGGAGEYVEFVITAPAATYTYTVGAAGTAGASGTGGIAGGAGGTGRIIVDEFYD
jgi:hypothetical protein